MKTVTGNFNWLKLSCIALLWLTSCRDRAPQKNHLFNKLSPATSGIEFANTLHENDSSYSFINEFGYMGGGVGIGDFNNDGLKDIYFTGNQVSSRLYINKGNNRFEDITDKAGVGTHAWSTGVSIADVNHDGFDDIYVCVFGKDLIRHEKNLLFINQQNLTFKEEAESYGLADTANSTQAVFFDYDRDGDLDMYLANYLLSENNANGIFPKDKTGHSPANDRLYRNEGQPAGGTHPVFTDVSAAAGIKEDGYGLGVSVSDFNQDGWPDIYVANDFLSNDELWLNNKNGTFSNVIAASMRHQSYSSMGVDAADLNNDTWTDVITLDMLPETNERRKVSFSFMNYERYETERSLGYEPEFVRNMLQLNNGVHNFNDTALPYFSEIGQLAGIHATDWSWSVLTPDLDLDGWKDLHITNGIGRDFINGDFLAFSGTIFGSDLSREEKRKKIREKLAELKHVNLPNYVYLNNRDYTFRDVSAGSGASEPSMSNGAAYADLDNDGDLDLVVNNINEEAFVLINSTITPDQPATTHYLTIRLKGDSLNTKATGAKLLLYTKGSVQLQEQNPVRGYFSTVDADLHFGLGAAATVDSLVILWPGQGKQVLQNLKTDTLLVITRNQTLPEDQQQVIPSSVLFSQLSSIPGMSYQHRDIPFNDYAEQRMLPQKYSQQGPRIVTGDVNGDGKTDVFIGGGFNFPGRLYLQSKDGTSFTGSDLGDTIKYQEDMDAVFLDADGDRDLDLLLSYGDTRYEENSVNYIPALYLNDGKGHFQKDVAAIPETVRTIAGCVAAGDYDQDGDMDVFIGGRVSKKYPLSPRSFLLQNNRGKFTDVTETVCPALTKPGMVTSAIWTDYDNDKQPDLVIAGDWMPVRFFKNNKGKLEESTASTHLAGETGMWRCLEAADVDGDGDTDFLAGNLGANCDYRCTPETPMELCAADIDKNGSVDPVLFYYIKTEEGNRKSVPANSLPQIGSQVPALFKQFLHYKEYTNATFAKIFRNVPEKDILRLQCTETRSCWLENLGNGSFQKHVLPVAAQFAPVNAMICSDFDKDGIPDLLLAGNEYQTEVITGRYDASYGLMLKGNRNKEFTVVPPAASGFFVIGDVRDMALVSYGKGQQAVLAAVNNDSLRAFSIR